VADSHPCSCFHYDRHRRCNSTNNLLNDLIDFRKGIDHNNYYRSLYGPHPLEHGFLSKKAFMNYIYVSGALAFSLGILITCMVGLSTLWLVGAGLFLGEKPTRYLTLSL
jgi:1,4-dihydroxy-2-naphthoate octaprenyltransferase